MKFYELKSLVPCGELAFQDKLKIPLFLPLVLAFQDKNLLKDVISLNFLSSILKNALGTITFFC